MKYANVELLVFDKDGSVSTTTDVISDGDYSFDVGLHGIDAYFMRDKILTSLHGSVFYNGYYIQTKLDNLLGSDFCFLKMSKPPTDFQYCGIFYHSQLQPLAYSLFFLFAKFYLPEREPRCSCCNSLYNDKWLPYVNRIFRSMNNHFGKKEYEGYEYTKDHTLRMINETNKS